MTRFRAFSTIELVVSLAITLIIMQVILMTWMSGIENFTLINFKQGRDSAFIEMYQRADRFVRVATEFPDTYTSPEGATYTADPSGATSTPTLIMKLNAIQADGSICEGYFDYVIFDYDQTERTLREIVVTDPNSSRQSSNQRVATGVTQLTFLQNPATHRTVVLEATISQDSFRRSIDKTHKQTMVARNN